MIKEESDEGGDMEIQRKKKESKVGNEINQTHVERNEVEHVGMRWKETKISQRKATDTIKRDKV